MILNLGAGELPIEDVVNVDCYDTGYQDEIVDLSEFPWRWKDESIDGIYMLHVLEHFPEPFKIISECYRILKPGGFLFIAVPHSSLVIAIGCIGHYRTFSYATFRDYFGQKYYHISKPMFKTEIARILWWHSPRRHKNKYGINFKHVEKQNYPFIYFLIVRPLSRFIQFFVDLFPRIFERVWCYYVGGAEEVVWKGIKI
ncbi:MAG: class I SAM-dependent methyltransferase [bacterium]|nr:class I SAM-dependent methyltransferase [bacterium]